MAKYRTPKNKRDAYVYCDAYGRVVAELRPGEDGVMEEHIGYLHAADDSERNAASRDSYHKVYHYDQATVDGDEIPTDRQMDLADYSADPETIVLAKIQKTSIKKAWRGLHPKQRELVVQLLRNRTKVDIAREEGVSEAAIRKRLAKI